MTDIPSESPENKALPQSSSLPVSPTTVSAVVKTPAIPPSSVPIKPVAATIQSSAPALTSPSTPVAASSVQSASKTAAPKSPSTPVAPIVSEKAPPPPLKPRARKKRLNPKPHHFIHFIFAIIIAVFSIVLAVSFETAQQKIVFMGKIISKVEGDASIIDEFGNDRRVVGDAKMFTGETISTSEGSHVNVLLGDSSEIRLASGTEVKFKSKNKIYLKSGQIWVFANQKIEIETDKVSFLLENASGDFIYRNNAYKITSWRHLIEVTLPQKDDFKGENLNRFLLPVGTRIIFSGLNLTEDLQRLRFSKIKKEFKFHIPEITEYETLNNRRDKALLAQIADEYFMNMQVLKTSNSDLSFFRNIFTVIPKKKSNLEAKKLDANIDNMFVNLASGNFEEANKILITSDFSVNQIRKIWETANFLANEINFLRLSHNAKTLWISKDANNKELNIKFLRSSLSLMEDFVKLRNEGLFKIESEYFKNLWENFDNDDHIEISGHIETFIKIANLYTDRVDNSLIDVYDWLNELALMREDEQNQNVLRLEIAQNNLGLMELFLKNENYVLAKEIINISQEKLNIANVPAIFNLRSKILAKEALVNEKLAFVDEAGAFDDDDFKKYLNEKERAASLLAELEKIESQTNKNKTIEGMVSEVSAKFAKEDIVIISCEPQQDSKNIFIIKEAVLPNKSSFSAIYNNSNDSLSSIIIADKEQYTRSVFLDDFVRIADQILQNNTSIHAVADEDEDLEELSPEVILLIRKLAQSKLEQAGITVELQNVKLIGAEKTEIKKANIYGYETEISLIFDIKNSICSAVVFDQNVIESVAVNDVLDEIKSILDAEIQVEYLNAKFKNDFKKLGIKIDDENDEITLEADDEIVRFKKITYKINDAEFLISGIYDIDSSSFRIIAEVNGQFDALYNVNLASMRNMVMESYRSDSEVSKVYLVKQLKEVFDLHGCSYQSSAMEADSESGKVLFSGVHFERYNIKIAGQFDTKNNKFVRISSPAFGIREDITLEELDSELFIELDLEN